jgi:hypothetical protein
MKYTSGNSRTFPIESLAHDSERTLVCAEYGYHKGLQIPTVKEEIRRYSSQYSARLSTLPNDLIVNLMSYQTTGDCEDTCQMICLLDS